MSERVAIENNKVVLPTGVALSFSDIESVTMTEGNNCHFSYHFNGEVKYHFCNPISKVGFETVNKLIGIVVANKTKQSPISFISNVKIFLFSNYVIMINRGSHVKVYEVNKYDNPIHEFKKGLGLYYNFEQLSKRKIYMELLGLNRGVIEKLILDVHRWEANHLLSRITDINNTLSEPSNNN